MDEKQVTYTAIDDIEIYFEWLVKLVCQRGYLNKIDKYSKLLRVLHHVEYCYILDMDDNRLEDGLDLRNRFLSENPYYSGTCLFIFENEPCSILEMMIALSIRCEEQIMTNENFGNRESRWFWDMIESLGLKDYTNVNLLYSSDDYPVNEIEYILYLFMKNDYAEDGRGGLFTIPKQIGMPDQDIWCQMCWYISYILEVEGE